MNITTNGNSVTERFDGGKATVAIYGEFDGATVQLQANFGGTTWVTIQNDSGENVEFTENSCKNLEIAGCNLRAVTANGGGSLDLIVLIKKIFENTR